MSDYSLRDLHAWCSIPVESLVNHPYRKVPFRLVQDSEAMGWQMARDLIDEIVVQNNAGEPTRVIVPCGPMAWYAPWTEMVNAESVSLANVHVFHMDECLDWQGKLLPRHHPYNFRTTMESVFYGGIRSELNVPETQRYWLTPATAEPVQEAIQAGPIHMTLGGWGQDGHVAYNQARRHPFSRLTVEDLETSSVRVQDNNVDTIIALGQRTFGAAFQLVPPMSVTLGVQECLSARKVRVYSNTGAWKQTALRVALFGPITVDYPMTLMQKHPDALITATRETADHPISHHPEWDFFGAAE